MNTKLKATLVSAGIGYYLFNNAVSWLVVRRLQTEIDSLIRERDTVRKIADTLYAHSDEVTRDRVETDLQFQSIMKHEI